MKILRAAQAALRTGKTGASSDSVRARREDLKIEMTAMLAI